MRKITLIFGAALVVLALCVAIYFMFFNSSSQVVPGDSSSNPFGNAGAGGTTVENQSVPELGVPVHGAGEEVAPQFFKITDGPIAEGVAVFPILIPQETVGTTTVPLPPLEDTEVRYVDRASGNVYRFQLDARKLERLTNLTLPGIQLAAWATDGSRAFVRFLTDETGAERIETYSLPADGSDGYFLEPGLSDVVVTGTSTVLSVLPSTNGSVGTRSTLLGASPVTVFNSPLSALRLFTAGNNYAAVTKASALLPGYAFSVSRATGEFARVLGPLSGLSILPGPSGTQYLYSYRDSGALRLAFLNTGTREAVSLPVVTLADKCVWAHNTTVVYCAVPRTISGTYPDDWYLGTRSTSDRIWEIDLATRVATLSFDPSVLAEVDIDAIALTLDTKDDVLVFTNKNDGSLWLYDL